MSLTITLIRNMIDIKYISCMTRNIYSIPLFLEFKKLNKIQNTSIHQAHSIGQSFVSKKNMLLRDSTNCRWLNYFLFVYILLVLVELENLLSVCHDSS